MTKIHKARIRKLATYLAGPVARAEARVNKKDSGAHKFDMGTWASAPKIGLTKRLCGTTACAMGWATAVFPRHIRLGIGDVPCLVSNSSIRGDDIGGPFFGMSYDQSLRAFMSGMKRTPKEEAEVLRQIAIDGN